MAQFISFDPDAKVYGASMLSVIEGMGERIRPVLAAHGMEEIKPDEWYPVQNYLDFYREISQARYNATLNLVSTGIRVPEKAVFPDNIDSITKAFQVLDEAFQMNHRGNVGHYHVHVIRDRQIEVVAENPFPCDMDYGLMQGLARRFKPAKSNLLVYHDPKAPCRKKGADTCTYHISW